MIEQISKLTLPFDSGRVEAEILQKNKLLSFFVDTGYIQYYLLLQWTIENDVEICKEVWSGVARNIFGVSTFALQFLIPLIISGK